MEYILNKSLENIESLWHFYDIQRGYIDKKSKQGMKEYEFGYLADYYFSALLRDNQEEQKQEAFIKIKEIVEKYIDIIDNTDKSVLYLIKEGKKLNEPNVAKSAKAYKEYREMPITHANNTIIMLITRFEEFVADFIRFLYNKFPKKYLDEKTITFSEIADKGIDAVKDKIICREVEHIMWQSYGEWFKLFASHKIFTNKFNKEFEELKELYARRNILVHNSGVVNEIYIKNVPNTSYRIGQRISSDEKYIKKAFDSVKTIIFCIMIEAVRLDADKSSELTDEIFNLAFDELNNGNYKICKTVFEALMNSDFIDAETKNNSQINYWIAKIEIDGFESVESDINNFDTSALKIKFDMAKNILLKKYEDATAIIEKLYEQKDLPLYALEEWPLFKEYKMSEEYSKFKSLHPELSGVIALERNTEIPSDNEEQLSDNSTALKVPTNLNQ